MTFVGWGRMGFVERAAWLCWAVRVAVLGTPHGCVERAVAVLGGSLRYIGRRAVPVLGGPCVYRAVYVQALVIKSEIC